MAVRVRRQAYGASARRVGGRRPLGAKRRVRLLAWSRVLGAVATAAAVAAGAWLGSDQRFVLHQSDVQVSGLVNTDPALVRQRVGVPARGVNVFQLNAAAIERALLELPAVEDADVRAFLPGSLVVSVIERVPLFAWRAGEQGFLVDVEGRLISQLAAPEQVAGGLPVVDDRRPHAQAPLDVGQALDPVDLDATLHLAAITPAMLDSDAERLAISIDRDDGFVIHAEPDGWRAVFGHYTPTLRPTAIIDRQVQCLRSRLATGEHDVGTIYLAVGDDECGTWLPRETERPAGTPGPDGSPAPSAPPDDVGES